MARLPRRRLPAILLWLTTAGIVGFYLRMLWATLAGNRALRRGAVRTSAAAALPPVTIIVPARNEARNIRRCVASLLAQTYARCAIVVVDDSSTDGTGAILAELRRGPGGDRLRVIAAGELPSGWAGKPHAMAAGAAVATGDWLLFTDADTLHRPDALAWAMQRALADGTDLFSLLTEQEIVDPWGHIILPIVAMGIAAQYPPAQIADPRRSLAIANGQYLLIRRAMYDAVGGYAGRDLRASVVDDRDLAAAVKARGGRLAVLDGTGRVSVCMYRTLAEQWRGWGKNAYAGSRGGPLLFLVFALALPIGTLAPYALVLAGLLTGRRSWVAAGGAQVAAIAGYRWVADRLLRHSAWWGWTHPVGGAVMTALVAHVGWRQFTRRGVEWSGRCYQVSQAAPGRESAHV